MTDHSRKYHNEMSEHSPDDSIDGNADDTAASTPPVGAGRPVTRADPALQVLTWAVLVLALFAAVVFGISLARDENDAPSGQPATSVSAPP